MFHILGFYKFKKIIGVNNNKINLQNYFVKNSIRGTLIISKEGINGTISAEKKLLDLAINKIKKTFKINNFDSSNLSNSKYQPFHRAKVKIKNEVVPLGIKVKKSKFKNYIEPSKWNKLINHNKTLLLDVRKPFEHYVGTFKGAVNPQVVNFREFPFVEIFIDIDFSSFFSNAALIKLKSLIFLLSRISAGTFLFS